ncbi:MAG: efflux RND transporter permease subunit, partial [Candidatus Hydrogenedentes bacterium]|nr:efflux RND transporter permease subunit [Candidatus Hydrogenedentota bacterium]
PGIRRILSSSDSGGCYLVLRFEWYSDMAAATADVRDRLERLKLKLPKDVDRIYLRKDSTQAWDLMRLALFREQDQQELGRLARTMVRSRLMRVPGVAEVEVSGSDTESVYVSFNQDKLRSLNMPIYTVITTLQTSSLNVTLGRINDGGDRFYVRAMGELESAKQLENIVIAPNGIRLKDVADVHVYAPAATANFEIDGKRGVFVRILKESEANTAAVCDAIKAEIKKLINEPEMEGVEMQVFHDQSDMIYFALNGLYSSGAYGLITALLVLFLFLRRVRPTLLVALTTPISLMAALAYLYFRGGSLNWVTLASMIVSLGMLVDNAIVVMENIHRHNQMSPDRVSNAIKGASEVAMAITASTLTTIVVFIPVFYLEAGELTFGMREFAGPVSVSLLASLVLALTLIPLAETHMTERRHHPIYKLWERMGSQRRNGGPPGLLAGAANRVRNWHPLKSLIVDYGWFVGVILKHRVAATMVVALMLAATYFIAFKRVGTQQMPDLDSREAEVMVNFERNFDYQMATEIFTKLTDIVEAQRETLGIRNLYVDYGAWGGVIRAFLVQQDDLAPGETFPYTTQEVRDIFSQQLPEYVPGGTLRFGVAQASPVQGQNISLLVRGTDTETVATVAEDFKNLLQTLPDVKEVRLDRELREEEIQLAIDGPLASRSGLSPYMIARTVDFALRGTRLPYLKKGGFEIPVQAQLSSEDRKTKSDLENLAVIGRTGLIPLNNITTMTRAKSPQSLRRDNGKSVINISASIFTKDLAHMQKEIARLIDSFQLPRGYSIEMGEEISEMETTVENVKQALVFEITLVYLVMAALFESYLLPLSILTTVPMAFIGIYWVMYLTGTPMDNVSYIGSILMCGIIVNNGIVIVDHINQLRIHGMERTAAICQGGIDRFRPVMMTALTTILGCVPIAISRDGGGDALNGLGRTLVGGLSMGTFLTLFLVPLFYSLIDDFKEWAMQYAAGLIHLGGARAPAADALATSPRD